MENLHRIVLGVHVLAGLTGLLTMIPPLVAKKGARVHRRVGFAFEVVVIELTEKQIEAIMAAQMSREEKQAAYAAEDVRTIVDREDDGNPRLHVAAIADLFAEARGLRLAAVAGC